MSEILLYYRRPDPTTWVYLSSFLTIGLYFVFRRFWSIRNLDLVLLILLAPGLLIVHEGYRRQFDDSETIVQHAADQHLQEDSNGDTDPLEKLPFEAFTDPSADGFERLLLNRGTTLVSQSTDSPDGIPPDDFEIDTATSGSDQAASSTSGDQAASSTPGDQAEATVDETLAESAARYRSIRRFGFIYLFVVEALLLIRLMLDPLMVRRPLLDPNLTSGGLTFIGISMFVFMMANVVKSDSRIQVTQGPALGPGYALMNMLPAIPTRPVSDAPGGVSPAQPTNLSPAQQSLARVAKTLAIAAQLAIVTGIVLFGNRHFGNLKAGVGCATLYLLLPYTAQMTGRVDHAIPAALLLWALLCYRRPLIAGGFIGLAAGLVYYPLFLLPLWFSFYWQRGAKSFLLGFLATLAILVFALSLDQSASLSEHLQRMFGLFNPNKDASELRGFWSLGLEPIWRLPVIVAFVILCVFFAIWPVQKNLGTLLSGSAAVMVAAQFWHGYGGGLYIAWFLPMLLLTIFRPNLQDRVATKMVITKRGKGSSRASDSTGTTSFASGT
ncbi:hypothetical protein Pla22_15580 [Rubripirellula amarantea]|uniref:Uncharacterized protein n=1 Tax=Rubripirellula amarantea TaxID=2527999 RepID=A0A5C5WSM1_9BACT|nr:glycosyltransferase family 87 protein [Rubripirellula amarantea]TWT53924.1 hypothetical protein Pla22_15580 [Rubripirellula amarantea]